MTKEERRKYEAIRKARNDAKKWYDCIANINAGYPHPANNNVQGELPITKGKEYKVFTDEKDFRNKVGLGITFRLKKKGSK